jgi:hypothetical protein
MGRGLLVPHQNDLGRRNTVQRIEYWNDLAARVTENDLHTFFLQSINQDLRACFLQSTLRAHVRGEIYLKYHLFANRIKHSPETGQKKSPLPFGSGLFFVELHQIKKPSPSIPV